ncbi:5772_t:CDS:2, partial [Diversispora eburnea]
KSYKAIKDSSTSTLRGHIACEHKQLNSEISTSRPLDKFVKSKTTLELSTDMNDATNLSIQKLDDYYPTSDAAIGNRYKKDDSIVENAEVDEDAVKLFLKEKNFRGKIIGS